MCTFVSSPTVRVCVRLQVSLFGLIKLQSFYLPWAFTGINLLMGQSIMSDLLGIAAGKPAQHTHTHTHTHTNTHKHTRTQQTHTNTHKHTHTQSDAYTHTNKHVYICKHLGSFRQQDPAVLVVRCQTQPLPNM